MGADACELLQCQIRRVVPRCLSSGSVHEVEALALVSICRPGRWQGSVREYVIEELQQQVSLGPLSDQA